MRRRQLRMFLSNLENLPELEVPAGYEIRPFQPGDEGHWASIIDASFGGERTAEHTRREIIDRPEYMPGGLFFATYEGKPVGTACAWRQSQEETEIGYVHMVGVVPEHRGHKLGKWLSLRVLLFVKEHGFQCSILDTDEPRLPAIKSYLNLGFLPLYREISQPSRWRGVFDELNLPMPYTEWELPFKTLQSQRGHVPLGKPSSWEMALRYTIQQGCALLEDKQVPQNKEELNEMQPKLRQRLRECIGLELLPPRTPMNAKTVSKTEREDCTIENIVFESRPNFPVTGNLYIPHRADYPAPAILVVPGHNMTEGKWGEHGVCLSLAKLGFVALAIDPVGQGERRVAGNEHQLGFEILLTGQSNEAIRVWDNMRAIDYLADRAEVDSDRIGMTGVSGGGEMTFYTSALDERIKVAAVGCFLTSYNQFLRYGGRHCMCNYLPDIIRYAEEFEIGALIAPRPLLILNGENDPIFPIEGTEDTYEQLKQSYCNIGVEERVSLVTGDVGHGFTQEMKEARLRWFEKWLNGKSESDVVEVEDDGQKDGLSCWQTYPASAETVLSLHKKLAEQLIAELPQPKSREDWEKVKPSLQKHLTKLLGEPPKSEKPFEAEIVEVIQREQHTARRVLLQIDPKVKIDAISLNPSEEVREQTCRTSAGCVVLWLTEGDVSECENDALAKKLLEAGIPIFALRPRGVFGDGKQFESHLVSDAVMVGLPLLGQQLRDIRRTIDYLAEDGTSPISMIASKNTALMGLWATALNPRISALFVSELLASYLEAFATQTKEADGLFDRAEERFPVGYFLKDMLKVADVPLLAALVAPRPLWLESAVDKRGNLLSAEYLQKQFAVTRNVYNSLGLPDNLRLRTPEADDVVRFVTKGC